MFGFFDAFVDSAYKFTDREHPVGSLKLIGLSLPYVYGERDAADPGDMNAWIIAAPNGATKGTQLGRSRPW